MGMCWIYPSACMVGRWTSYVHIVHFWKTCMSSLPLLNECIIALLSFVSITPQISLPAEILFLYCFSSSCLMCMTPIPPSCGLVCVHRPPAVPALCSHSHCFISLSPLLFPASFFLNIFGQLFLSGATLLFLLLTLLPSLSPSFSPLPPYCLSFLHSSLFTIVPSPPPVVVYPLPHLPPPPRWSWVNSWRCCSIVSVCPACRANQTPHQALGHTTPTKYFYLLIHPCPSGASWR